MIALPQLKTRRPLTVREIEIETGVPRATASRIIQKSKAISHQEDKENYDLNSTALATPAPKPKSGRPFKFDDEQRAPVVAMATRDASQRRKSWTTIAREMPFRIHRTSVSTILRDAGYTQAIAESKPRLSEKNAAHRPEFSTYWKDIPVRKSGHEMGADSDALDGWISTNEMHFHVGEHYGLELVTQLVGETEGYHKDCVNEERPGQTRIMFWGAIIYGIPCIKSPFFIWEEKTQEEKELAIEKLRRISYRRKQQQRRILTGMRMRWPAEKLYPKANALEVDQPIPIKLRNGPVGRS